MPEKIKTLYENLVSEGYDLPDFNTFTVDMNDMKKRQKFHGSLVSEGYDLPDFNTFTNDMGFGLKKKEQAIPFDGQQFGGKSEEPLLPLTSSTVSPSASKQPKSTIPLESTGAKSKQALFQNVDISKPELEVAEVKYDKVQERNRIQNYSQGLQKVQIDAAKKIKQRDDLFAGIEQMQVDLEASKSNPEQYNALIPQYNELVNSAKAITNDISADFNKIDIFEKGIGVTELKRQINEDTIGNRALEGVNSAKRILLEAFPATVQVASYLTQRSRGIDPATAEKVSIDIAENGFPNIKRWSRELAEENEDLRSVFDQTTAWDVLTEKDSSLLEKDWAKIGELSAKELVQTLPTTLAIMASYVNPIAGVTTTIMGTAGMELEELQGSDMTPDAKIANALTKGGLEYATEKVFGSIPMLKRAVGLKSKAGQEAYQNIVLETWNKFASKMGFAADVIEEVGSEMLNTIGGNYTDYLSGKTTEADLYKGLGETFTTSLTMASTLSGAGRAAKYGNKKINELRSATKKLKEISESQETTPEVLQVIQDKVVENNEKIAEEAKKEKQAFDSMDDRTFGEVTTLVQETQSLEQQLENNEVPEDVIPLVEEKIKKGYEQIDELTKQAKETNIEATGEVVQEGGKTENEIKVEELRAQEQAEKDATDPNDQEKLDEIYNRYDKLITPLLGAVKIEQAPALRDVESTAKALGGLDRESINNLEKLSNIYYHGNYGESIIDGKKNKYGLISKLKDFGNGIHLGTRKQAEEFLNQNKGFLYKVKLSAKDIKKGFDEEASNLFSEQQIDELYNKYLKKGFSENESYNKAITDLATPFKYKNQIGKSEALKYINTKEGGGKDYSIVTFNPDFTKIVSAITIDEKGESIIFDNSIKDISESYHAAKADGSNPELVQAVESLLSKEQTPEVKEQAVDAEKTGEKTAKEQNKRVFRAEQIAKSLGGVVVGSSTRKGSIPNDFDIYIENKIDLESMKNTMKSLGYKYNGASPVVDTSGKPYAGENQTAFSFINDKGQKVDVFQEETKEDYRKRVTKPLKEKEEVKASEPSKSGKNYQDAQNINSIVSKENPDVSVLIQPKGDNLVLTAIYVGKGKRRGGIGSKALETIKREAKKLGKKVVLDATNELDQETDLERLGNFYERNGFKKVGENKYEYDPKAEVSSGDTGSRTDNTGAEVGNIASVTDKGESGKEAVSEAEVVKKEKKTPPQNVLDIAKETGLSPQEIENTYKKYDGTKSKEEITIENYNSARAAGNEQKLENSKKAFEALLKADSDSPTAKKKAAKIKEEVSKETLKEASDIMNNIDNIRQQLLDAGVIKSINCKWGK